MSPIRGWVLYLIFVLMTPAPAPVRRMDGQSEELSTQLDALIAGHRYARAEALAQRRVDGGDDPTATYFQIGKSYFDHEQWQRSARFLQESLRRKNANDQAHQLLGLDWRELRRPDDAEKELLEAAKENPSNKVNTYLAGHQLLLNGKFEAALPYLYASVDSNALHSQVLQALALAQARLGNYGLAESYCRKVIDYAQSSDEDRYSALVNLSVLLLLGHDPAQLKEGLNCARRARELNRGVPEPHFLAGKALFKLGRLEEAEPELAKAAKLSPDDAKPHFLLAQLYERLGQHDRAEQERQRSASLQGSAGRSGMASSDPVLISPRSFSGNSRR